jgi:type I restriction enzyme S subunit
MALRNISSNLFPMQRLEEVADVNPSEISKIKNLNQSVSFIPMEAVSDKEGLIVAPQVRRFLEVSKGYTRFMENDVIWAKITPCMQNGKCAVAKQLENGLGFGSTEFHVIRSKNKDALLPEYLWVLLRMKHLRQAAQRYFIGSAGQQRVPADFLEGLSIPLPPLNVQREIVSQVQAQRQEIARLRAEAERKTQAIKADVEAWILGTRQVGEAGADELDEEGADER